SALSASELRRNLALLGTDSSIIDDCFLSARTVRQRLCGTGALAREQTLRLGLVGMAARSAGVSGDQRVPARGIYASLPAETVLEADGDCWARARLRIEECRRSLRWIERAVDVHPAWEAR